MDLSESCCRCEGCEGCEGCNGCERCEGASCGFVAFAAAICADDQSSTGRHDLPKELLNDLHAFAT
jgi:hypothetical protein